MARGGYVSLDDIDDDLFGEPHRDTVRYLRDRVERYSSRASEVFGDFFDDARELFEKYNGDRALRRIRSRIRKSGDVLRHDVVRPLRTMSELQNAKPTMQKYIMANIVLRALAQEQRIDGYSDSYQNLYPERRGEDDPVFMRVIDGMMFTEDRPGIVTEKGDDAAWVAHQDMNFNEDERDLDIVEQGDILSTWDFVEMFVAAAQHDPTSVLNEKL